VKSTLDIKILSQARLNELTSKPLYTVQKLNNGDFAVKSDKDTKWLFKYYIVLSDTKTVYGIFNCMDDLLNWYKTNIK